MEWERLHLWLCFPAARSPFTDRGPIMADGLKGMLTKVLQNKGRKKFFFAYGTGKRTDGQGDGHLIVANGKKPKRPDIEEECACSTFIEGRCWSSTDGGTLFFLGKSKL